MLIIAFMLRNYENLFIMMATQMAFKQLGMNIFEYALPYIGTVKKKITQVNQDYKKSVIVPFFGWTRLLGAENIDYCDESSCSEVHE